MNLIISAGNIARECFMYKYENYSTCTVPVP